MTPRYVGYCFYLELRIVEYKESRMKGCVDMIFLKRMRMRYYLQQTDVWLIRVRVELISVDREIREVNFYLVFSPILMCL